MTKAFITISFLARVEEISWGLLVLRYISLTFLLWELCLPSWRRLNCKVETLHCRSTIESLLASFAEEESSSVLLLWFVVETADHIPKNRSSVDPIHVCSYLVDFTFFPKCASKVARPRFEILLCRIHFVWNFSIYRGRRFTLLILVYIISTLNRLVLAIRFQLGVVLQNPIFVVLLGRIDQLVQIGAIENLVKIW